MYHDNSRVRPYHMVYVLRVLTCRLDLDVSFGEKTAVYIKMDVHDQLLLSEGVCHQLGIITYHQNIQRWQGQC